MDTWQTVRRQSPEKDSEVTIEGLSSEITRLNDELTCASEAHLALKEENERMKAALRAAERAFSATGNKDMVQRMKTGVTGEVSKSTGFRLPPSRRVA